MFFSAMGQGQYNFSQRALEINLVRGNAQIGKIDTWLGQWPFECDRGRKLEFPEIRESEYTAVRIRGQFDRFDLVSNNRDNIRRQLLPPYHGTSSRPTSELLVCVGCGEHMGYRVGKKANEHDGVALREDMVLRRGARLTESEIRRLVKTVSHTRLHFLVDDPNDRKRHAKRRAMSVALREGRGINSVGSSYMELTNFTRRSGALFVRAGFLAQAEGVMFFTSRQVGQRVDAPTAAAFDDGVQDRSALSGFGAPEEHEVFLSDGCRADGVFDEVVVNLDPSIPMQTSIFGREPHFRHITHKTALHAGMLNDQATTV